MPVKPVSGLWGNKGTVNREKVSLSLAALVVAFIVADLLFTILIPDASGVPKSAILSVIAAVVITLIVAVVVTGIIFALMFLYEDRVKKTYIDPLEKTEIIVEYSASRIRIGGLSIAMVLWMVILYLWWKDVTVPSFDPSGSMIHLLSSQFGAFVPFIAILGFAIIVVNILHLAVSEKWILWLAETILNSCAMLLFYEMIQYFPFNSGLSPVMKAIIFMVLVFAFLVMALGVAKNLMQMLRLIRYSDGSWNRRRKTQL